jgi:rubrerythrin
MTSCAHTTLELLPEPKGRLRCRHCHLTITRDDLKDGYCPECFDGSGEKRYEFAEIAAERTEVAHYRCEECGVIIKSR